MFALVFLCCFNLHPYTRAQETTTFCYVPIAFDNQPIGKLICTPSEFFPSFFIDLPTHLINILHDIILILPQRFICSNLSVSVVNQCMIPTRGLRQNKSSGLFKNVMRFVRKLMGTFRGSTSAVWEF